MYIYMIHTFIYNFQKKRQHVLHACTHAHIYIYTLKWLTRDRLQMMLSYYSFKFLFIHLNFFSNKTQYGFSLFWIKSATHQHQQYRYYHSVPEMIWPEHSVGVVAKPTNPSEKYYQVLERARRYYWTDGSWASRKTITYRTTKFFTEYDLYDDTFHHKSESFKSSEDAG